MVRCLARDHLRASTGHLRTSMEAHGADGLVAEIERLEGRLKENLEKFKGA